ncbi:hypothetical protein ACFV6B_04140 [Streptomyces microflavus]|uniref:hypothetical protein n=1 Tax=Streptomyces microflavus TaxID=1919 RepID=UPI003669A449
MSTHQDDHPDAEPGRAAPSPLLYKSGSERDQQVRARLAELGVASGAQMEEVLRQLAEANTALGPDRPAPPEDDSVPGPGPGPPGAAGGRLRPRPPGRAGRTGAARR